MKPVLFFLCLKHSSSYFNTNNILKLTLEIHVPSLRFCFEVISKKTKQSIFMSFRLKLFVFVYVFSNYKVFILRLHKSCFVPRVILFFIFQVWNGTLRLTGVCTVSIILQFLLAFQIFILLTFFSSCLSICRYLVSSFTILRELWYEEQWYDTTKNNGPFDCHFLCLFFLYIDLTKLNK